MADLQAGADQPILSLTLAPKQDGVVAATNRQLWHAQLDPESLYPEATPATLFCPVWYEGYDKPQYVWQSSSSNDSYEPKFGLVPLIFGTLKGAFYSLLIGVPIALLAAIYTSEFLAPRLKMVVKPAIEMMASVPSVVLGFVAGLVLAQFVEQVLAAVTACAVTIPLAFCLGAYFWQLLPERLTLILSRWRFAFILLVLPLGLGGAALLGPALERLFFDGNLRAWLDDRKRPGTVGAWLMLFLPLSYVVVAFLSGRLIVPHLRRLTVSWSRTAIVLLDISKFLAGGLVAVLLALLVAVVFDKVGFDPRGSFLGGYSQRNALVVGLAMGFAIIPIIFTMAEDAFSSIPDHLRSGSLACGATRWQTATRIVIPTAMSGVFSALMIGTGRAVGETMIMLMGTGNTPLMDLNIFNGFRTLAANIAVEMPEAAHDSTHWRVLFLCGLVLFAMTFVLNTAAEAVRLRFRKRAYQL